MKGVSTRLIQLSPFVWHLLFCYANFASNSRKPPGIFHTGGAFFRTEN